MWPQPIFLNSAGKPIEVVCRLWGEANVSGGTTTVPTPSCALPGDYQVLLFTYSSNGSPQHMTVDWGINDNQWQQIMWAQNARPHLAFRKIASGHAPFAMSLAGGGYLAIRYVTFILRNVLDYVDPFPMVVSARPQSYSYFGTLILESTRAPRTPSGLRVISNKDLILSAGGQAPTRSLVDIGLPPETGPVLLAQWDLDPDTSGAPNSIWGVLHRQVKREVIDSGPPLTGWTVSNMTSAGVSAAQEVGYREASGSGLRLGFYKDFNLVAGETYELGVSTSHHVQSTTGTFSRGVYFGYIDPSAVEHGVALSTGANLGAFIGTQVVYKDLVRSDYYNNGFGQLCHAYSFRIRPTQTGVHRVWIGYIRQGDIVAGLPNLANQTGSTGSGPQISGIVFSKLPSTVHTDYIGTGGGYRRSNPARRDSIGVQLAIGGRADDETSSLDDFCAVVKGSADKRPLAKLLPFNEPLWIAMGEDGLTMSTNNDHGFPLDGLWTAMMYSDHIVNRRLGAKFYYEINITTMPTSYPLAAGFNVAGTEKEFHNNNLNTTQFPQHYCYFSSGAAYVEATGVTGLTPLAAGDVLGVELDLGSTYTHSGSTYAVKFYINGVLEHSIAINSDRYANSFRAAVRHSASGAENTSVRYDVNFKGPFVYKPVGALPYDFDNGEYVYRVNFSTAEGTIGPSTPVEFFYPPGTTSGDLIICYIYNNFALNIAGLPANTTYVTRRQGYTGQNEGLLFSNVVAYWIAGSEKSVTLTDTVASRSVFLSMTAYRNVNQTYPIGELVVHHEGATWHSAVATSDLTGAFKSCSGAWLGQRPNGSAYALRAYMLFPADFIDDSTPDSAPWETPGSELIEYTHPWTGGGALEVSYEGNTGTPRTVQNLLQYARRGMNSWALTNITNINNNATSGDETVTQFDLVYDPVLPTEHYWSQVVNLEAGKWYTFLSHVKINSYYAYLAVDDGVSGLRGAIFGQSIAYTTIGTPSSTYFGMAQWTPTNNVAAFWRHCGLYFKAEVTGSHTVRCGVAYQIGTTTWPPSAQPPGGAHQFYGASLVEGFYPHIREALMPVGATNGSVTAGTGALITNPVGWTSNKRFSMLEYEVVPTTATPADVVLYGLGQHHNVQFTDDLLETKSSLFAAGYNEMPTAVATHPATPGGKHYVEVTVVSLEVANWTVGLGIMTPFVQGYSSGYSPIYTLDQEGFWSYSQGSGGALHDDGVDQTSVGAALTPGDVVGIAADLTLGQITFYKNGVQVGTTMTGIPTNQLIQFYLLNMSEAQTDSTTNRLRVNFKGPFSYPVSGFSPWQWW